MNWDFLDVFDILTDVLDLLGNTSTSSESSCEQKALVKKKTKYLTEKISAVLLLFSIVLLFFVFKNPLPAENYIQTLMVGLLIGVVISLVFSLSCICWRDTILKMFFSGFSSVVLLCYFVYHWFSAFILNPEYLFRRN